MKRNEIIMHLGRLLKERGYRKHGQYWFLSNANILFCVNIQGSQWDAENYFVNIGVAKQSSDCQNPTILKWLWRHRCRGKNGEVNLPVEEIIAIIDKLFSDFLESDTSDFYIKHKAQFLIGQYWL